MAFQNFALFPHMSAFENIASPLEARRAKSDAVKEGVEQGRQAPEDRACAEPCAARAVQRPEAAHRARPRAGRRRRKILLLDDPLRNVDAKLRFEMRLELPRLLRELGSTVLYVTQDYKEAMALADRIAVLIGGTLRAGRTRPTRSIARPATVERGAALRRPDDQSRRRDARRDRRRAGRHARQLAIRLGPAHAGLDRKHARLGIRPEAVRFCEARRARTRSPSRSSAVTPLNERTVLLLVTARRHEILASLPPHEAMPAADAQAHVALRSRRHPSFRSRDAASASRRQASELRHVHRRTRASGTSTRSTARAASRPCMR